MNRFKEELTAIDQANDNKNSAKEAMLNFLGANGIDREEAAGIVLDFIIDKINNSMAKEASEAVASEEEVRFARLLTLMDKSAELEKELVTPFKGDLAQINKLITNVEEKIKMGQPLVMVMKMIRDR